VLTVASVHFRYVYTAWMVSAVTFKSNLSSADVWTANVLYPNAASGNGATTPTTFTFDRPVIANVLVSML
jgi:hypothetical protein